MNPQEAFSRFNFFHSLEVEPGVFTPGVKWASIYQSAFEESTKEIDFDGKRVIDIGCRDGAMLFVAEKRGAKELLGVDNDLSPALTEFLIPHFNSKIKTMERNLYDLGPEELGKFDIVIACGLLYHLKYPVYGMKKLSSLLKPGGTLILETALFGALDGFPLIHYCAPEKSPYEKTSVSFPNLSALRNMCDIVGLKDIEILKRFNPLKFKTEDFYPGTSGELTNLETFIIDRAIISASKDAEESELDRYFEQIHTKHRTNGKKI